MPRDTQTKLSKKSKKQEEMNMKKKKNQESDSDNDSIICSDSDVDDEMDVQEYRKFISKIFPSKHINNKIKAGNKLKKTLDADEEDEYDVDYDNLVVSDILGTSNVPQGLGSVFGTFGAP